MPGLKVDLSFANMGAAQLRKEIAERLDLPAETVKMSGERPFLLAVLQRLVDRQVSPQGEVLEKQK